MLDYRDPALRRQTFMHSWQFHIMYGTHPGCVHHLLPAIADAYELDDSGLAWLVWLNGNTQNPASSMLLLEASGGSVAGWRQAIDFWDEHFTMLEWDIDRRHQKSAFAKATEKLVTCYGVEDLERYWLTNGLLGWDQTWRYANSLPFMGRLSAWSMTEYARILFGDEVIPDADSLILEDASGSRSHRSGLAVVAGYDAPYWTWEETKDMVPELAALGESLLADMQVIDTRASRLNLESALCCYKSWHKPKRRYPNVYADMAYNRIRKAESRFGDRFETLWEARRVALPTWARLEDTPNDPGMVVAKQEHYLHTGQPIMMGHVWPEYWSDFDQKVEDGGFGER